MNQWQFHNNFRKQEECVWGLDFLGSFKVANRIPPSFFILFLKKKKDVIFKENYHRIRLFFFPN